MKSFFGKIFSVSYKKIIILLYATSSVIRRWPRTFFFSLMGAALITTWFWKRPIAGIGGLPFFRGVEISTPLFSQEDLRWAEDRLGYSEEDTLASAGCALCSAAMVLASYGVIVTPKLLNQYLIEHDGYEEDSWIKWEVAADYPPGVAEHRYEDLPSYGLIDWNLLCGNPVIVRIRRPSGRTHFVVIVGKERFHYLIRDPASQGDQGVYSFSQLGTPIEALRFYRKKK
jgi:hypothetical protein